MQLSTDGTTVIQTDSFLENSITTFDLVADILIESPLRTHALLCATTFNGATGQTVLATVDFAALSISYMQTIP